jgi:hypothetical protein
MERRINLRNSNEAHAFSTYFKRAGFEKTRRKPLSPQSSLWCHINFLIEVTAAEARSKMLTAISSFTGMCMMQHISKTDSSLEDFPGIRRAVSTTGVIHSLCGFEIISFDDSTRNDPFQ